MVNGTMPVFVTVSVRALLSPTVTLPNARTFCVKLILGMPPVPFSKTHCDPGAALSKIVSVALSGVVLVGVKVTLSVQLPLGRTGDGQSLVWVNMLLLAPVMVTLLMVRLAFPMLVSVNCIVLE